MLGRIEAIKLVKEFRSSQRREGLWGAVRDLFDREYSTLRAVDEISFAVEPGMYWYRAYVALGRANHVAVVEPKSRKVLDYILVGKRAWGLALTDDERLLYVANGLSDDVTIIDTASLKPVKSVPVGLVPYGILIDDR